MGGANLKFQIKRYDDSEEKIDMVYNSLKYYGRPISDEAEKKLDSLLKEKDKLSDLYCQLIKDQKDFINEQQEQIKSLNERLKTLEELLFNFLIINKSKNYLPKV